MALAGTRVFVALDAAAVIAAAVGGGARGRRLRAFCRAPLAPGALSVSSLADNVARADQVREGLAAALAGLGQGASRATLVLPDGLARLVLLALPPGADGRDFVRFRLAPTLPWPAADAVIDVLPLGKGRAVAAAVRRATVAEYEQVLGSCGLAVERVHLAPLLALSSVARTGGRGDAVHVLLGDAAASLVAVRDGTVCALRSRRRDPSPGEAARLAREALLTMRVAGDGAVEPRLVCAGSGAEVIRAELQCFREASPGDAERGFPAAADVAWLRGVLS